VKIFVRLLAIDNKGIIFVTRGLQKMILHEEKIATSLS